MAKSLQDFLNAVQTKGVRKTNQFQLEFSTGYSDVDNALENATVWATTAEVPGRTIEYIDLPYQGFITKVAGTVTMEQEHNLSIRVDNAGDIRKAFLKWQNYVANMAIGQGSNLGGNKQIPTSSFVRMKMLADDMQTVVETYKLVGVGCSVVGPMAFTNEGVEIMTFDVTLVSQYNEIEDNTGDFQDLL